MTDIDAEMARNRPKFDGPSEANVERQREALSRVVEAESSRMSRFGAEPEILDGPPINWAQSRSRRSVALATAATVLVVGGLAAVGWYSTARSDSTIDTVSAAPQVSATADVDPPVAVPRSSDEAPVVACEMVPLGELIPSGYDGPFAGPSPDTGSPAGQGQIVQHWTASAGSIELRWPPDATYDDGLWAPLRSSSSKINNGAASSRSSTGNLEGNTALEGGRHGSVALGSWAPSEPQGCSFPQVTVFDDSPELALLRAEDLIREVTDLSEVKTLIADRVRTSSVPDLSNCLGLPGSATSSTIGRDTPRLGPFESATEALEELLSRDDLGLELPLDSYLEFLADDGKVFYGSSWLGAGPLGPDEVFAVLIQVAPTDAGWTLESWEVAGCGSVIGVGGVDMSTGDGVPRTLPPPLVLWANQWINSTGLMANFQNDEVTSRRIDEACSVDLSDRDVNDALARKYIEADGGDVADPDLVLKAAQSIWLAARNICPSRFAPEVIDAGPPGFSEDQTEEERVRRSVDDAIRDAVVGSTDGPLVVGSVAIPLLPSVAACDVGLANYGAKFRDFIRYETAAEVLEELVSRTDLDVGIPLPQHGYLELQFGDGSIFYGTGGSENVFGVLVHVIPFEDAWALQSWETSGC